MDGETTMTFTFDEVDLVLEGLNDWRAELQEEWRRGTRDAVGDRLDAIIARFAVAWEGLREDD